MRQSHIDGKGAKTKRKVAWYLRYSASQQAAALARSSIIALSSIRRSFLERTSWH